MVNYTSFFSRVAEHLQGSAIRKMGVMALRDPDLISFAPGYPDPITFAWDDFRGISSELLAAQDATALQYGPTRGLPPLIDAIVQIVDNLSAAGFAPFSRKSAANGATPPRSLISLSVTTRTPSGEARIGVSHSVR